jgi:D-arabinose 5-phosphate isomerase GutQ
MPRIVPSQVVELIDQLYPGANSGADLFITSGETQKIAAVLASVKEIPQELITLGGQDFSNFAVA